MITKQWKRSALNIWFVDNLLIKYTPFYIFFNSVLLIYELSHPPLVLNAFIIIPQYETVTEVETKVLNLNTEQHATGPPDWVTFLTTYWILWDGWMEWKEESAGVSCSHCWIATGQIRHRARHPNQKTHQRPSRRRYIDHGPASADAGPGLIQYAA